MAAMERRGMAVCHECRLMLRQFRRTAQLPFATAVVRQWMRPSLTTTSLSTHSRRKDDFRIQNGRARQIRNFSSIPPPRHANATSKDLSSIHSRILQLSSTALQPEDHKLPSEQRILYVLEQLHALATDLIDPKSISKAARQRDEKDTTTATSALLGSVNALHSPTSLSKASLLNTISEKAEEILRHPNVFITPAILSNYVELQTLLHQPSSFPDIFHLYASKPLPTLTSHGHVEYHPVSSPSKINAAISSQTANLALTSAITAHNLPLCIDIITTTFSTPAYKKSKLLRQALLPFSGLLIAPVAAYALSTQFSLYQTTMDPTYATGVAFAGIMTYIATISALGYVVITTANDQMDRVTWAKGVPLWERWVREEERAALDRVAGKWGFRDVGRRGQEEGVAWEELREGVGRRGMVLDRVELMEGME